MKTVNLEIDQTADTTQEPQEPFYELIIKYMHGDADAYTTETFEYDAGRDVDDLKQDLIALEIMKEVDEDELEEELLVHFSAEDVESLIENFGKSDVTNDGNSMAQIQNYHIVYHDENDVKKPVKVTFQD